MRRSSFGSCPVSSSFGSSESSGFSLLEVMASVVALAAVVVGVSVLTQQSADEARGVLVAQHIRTIAGATESYLQKNYETIVGLASADHPVIISVDKLITDGHLPGGFSATTPQGQTVCAVVRKTSDNKLQPLVVAETPSGNSGYDDVTLAQIVTQLGAGGGGVYARDVTADRDVIRGAMGGWVLEGADKEAFEAADAQGGTCAEGGTASSVAFLSGTPTYALWLQDDTSLDATLYRDAVPGRPSLNTMNTPILMGDNTVRTAQDSCGKLADGVADVPAGALARDTDGRMLSCQVKGGVRTWQAQGSLYWGDPVQAFADLGTCDAASDGVTRVVKSGNAGIPGNTAPRAYTCKGTTWIALGLDDNGDLRVPGDVAVGDDMTIGDSLSAADVTVRDDLTVNDAVTIHGTIAVTGKATLSGGMDVTGRSTVNDLQVVNNVTAGSACPGGAADNGRLGRDTSGKILSCQNGTWKTALGGTLGSTTTNGVISYRDESGAPGSYTTDCPAGSVLVGLYRYDPLDSYYLRCATLQ